uniref:Retrovirus-related Pol polyprotein from transposon TNT 1-94 n=1 Tax=Tanacetum cinerariifolium TaxID=118510 RepID=A0A6L2JFD7_TANCI|nr:retrovirus-related Pol polyprotein from transposon TNT 1-94 [Tanacetum cinerariifolium]
MASASPICLMARASSTKSWLWHQCLSHLNFDTINDLARNNLVSGLPKFKYNKEHLCPSCEQRKSKRASHPPKPVPNSRKRLHLLHMDLCGPMSVTPLFVKKTSRHNLGANDMHAGEVIPEYDRSSDGYTRCGASQDGKNDATEGLEADNLNTPTLKSSNQVEDQEARPKVFQLNEHVESDEEVDEFIFPKRDKFEQRLAKKNKLKARGTLLIALLDKHQLKFNIHKDAKSLMEAIEKRFREWKTHTLIWRNKVDLDEQILDDLFNNLKIYEAEVKGLSPSSQNTQNIAFVCSYNTDSINESVTAVSISAPSISAASSKATVSTLPNVDSLSDAVTYSFFASQSNIPQLDNEYLKQIDPNDLEEIDLKSPRDNRNKETTRRTILTEVSTLNALVSQCDEVGGYDWSFQDDEEPTNFALMAYTSSKNLSKLLESQVSDKTSLGFDSQVFNSQVFDCEELHNHEYDNRAPKSLENDRYNIGEGYHVVPPPYTGTFMPPKPDLVFTDDPTTSESIANVFNVKSSTNKPSKDMSKTHRPDAPIVED